jgi:poly(3-hydroxybutyrate) depolymerase
LLRFHGIRLLFSPVMGLRHFFLLGLTALFTSSAFARHQDTGFLNRTLNLHGTTHKYQVYVPENWDEHQRWPVILFLHGSGERGTDGMDQTQIGLPAAIRSHPDRWPFVVVMPQVPFEHHHWTDPDMMEMAIAALDASVKEFHGDSQRLYLTGLSLGGYGTWEIAKNWPHKFAAVVPVCGGVFWSYAPDRWHDTDLPEQYARAIGRTPVWIFHGAEDPVVIPKQAVLMYEAIKANNGDVRFWEYAAVHHNAWDKAYADPLLPRWLLSHTLSQIAALQPASEYIVVPVHPTPAKVNPSIYDGYAGQYEDQGVIQTTIYRQGDSLYARSRVGESNELLPENPTTFFYASGSPTRLIFQKDASGQIRGLIYHDDRHEEFWALVRSHHAQQ